MSKLSPEEAHLGTSKMKFPARPQPTQATNTSQSAPKSVRIREVEEVVPVAPPPAAAPAPTPSGALPVQIFLPSRCEFYPEVKDVFVRPMKGFHQSKFYRAAHEKSDRHVANAITTLLSQDIGLTKALDASMLTIPDFFFIMYWIRLNSYTKTPLVHRGVCNNRDHLEEVASGKREKESLVSIVHLKQTMLEQTELPEDYLEGFEDELQFLMERLSPLGLTLTAPRMYDIIELHDDLLPEHKENEEEIRYMADRAACVMKEDGSPISLKERIDILSQEDVDVLDLLDEWRLRVSTYGIKESVKFKCDGCGAEVENAVLISAHSFL